MQQDNEQKIRRSSDIEERTFKPRPVQCDIDELGRLLVERNRKVLDMLEEYDRRQEKQQRKQG